MDNAMSRMEAVAGDLDIKKMFQLLTTVVIQRIQEDTEKILEDHDKNNGSNSKMTMNAFVDAGIQALNSGIVNIIDNLSGQNLLDHYWREAQRLCLDFVNDQCQWIISRCQEIWDEDARLLDIRVYQLRNKTISDINEYIENLRIEKKKQRFDKAFKQVQFSSGTRKMAIVGLMCFLLGLFIGILI